MSHFHRCEGCGDPGVERGFRYCGSCAVLLDGIEDVTVEPPPATLLVPEPVVKPKPRRDGKWLAWAAAKRGQMHWFHRYGQQRGFPRDIRQWSAGMVEIAVQAIQAKQANA